MNTEVVLEVSKATAAGGISFSDVVKALAGAGVEYYHVDYVAMRTTFYGAPGDVAVKPILFEGMPAVAAELDVAAVKANILDSQRNGQNYRDFTRRAMAGGVQGYYAFLRGQRVTYIGRTGDAHTEWFPGAKPAGK